MVHRCYGKFDKELDFDCLWPSPQDPAEIEFEKGPRFISKAHFIAILKAANHHGIKVVVEIDMPSHARAAIQGFHSKFPSVKISFIQNFHHSKFCHKNLAKNNWCFNFEEMCSDGVSVAKTGG